MGIVKKHSNITFGAKLNHAPSQFKMGYLHEMIDKFGTASKYYVMSAEQNFALHHLALLYLHGNLHLQLALPPNNAATSLLLSSAQRIYPPSHYILAFELKHEPSLHFEKAASLKYEPALEKLGRTIAGPLWTGSDCLDINQPDFPYLVPGPEEPKEDTKAGYSMIPSAKMRLEARLKVTLRSQRVHLLSKCIPGSFINCSAVFFFALSQ
jgi:hypothetical protein